MTTKTAICNRALTLMAASPSLVQVDTDATVHAAKLKAIYDTTRDAALRAHAWNFATVRTTLAKSATAVPDWGYGNQYELPAEYLGQLRFSRDHHGSRKPEHRVTTDRTRGGRWVQTNEGSPIYVEYVMRVLDTALYDPMFVEYFAAKLAEVAGHSINGNVNVGRDMRDYAVGLARDARWADAVDTGRDAPDQGEFLASRAIP